jgi:hypothetical protein
MIRESDTLRFPDSFSDEMERNVWMTGNSLPQMNVFELY